MELHEHECLPRLLDLDPSPPLGRQRWLWRDLHRWRRRLFGVWQADTRQPDKWIDEGQEAEAPPTGAKLSY